MRADRPINPLLQRHIDTWKKCWDFLGGTRSWDESLKRWNAELKANKKKSSSDVKEEDVVDIETIAGGTIQS